MSEIKMDCPYCGCDKDKIHKVGGKEPKDWKPPFLDIFDSIQNYTQF